MSTPLLLLTALLAYFGSCYGSQPQTPLQGKHDLSSVPIRPPPEAWQSLNESVGGRLSIGLPVGLPCYKNFNGEKRTPNKRQCRVVDDNRNNTDYLVSQASGYCQGNWGICQLDNIGCPTSPTNPIDPDAQCRQGAIASHFLNVSSVSDVQKALVFANKYNYPVVVKNSGHDYKGRSAAPDSLAIWIHNYRPTPSFDKSFIPEGCAAEVGDVITFGAGQDFNGLYAFANKSGVTVVGGSSSTVAPAGGWITGGGHSALSPVYGLGADNVQQIRVVLPNGTFVTANHCQNQDIFFALRGGGGGTFGVNMEMSVLAHRNTPVQFALLTLPGNSSTDIQRQLLSILTENANVWFDQGWGGYAYPTGALRSTFPVQLMNPKLTKDEAESSLKPLIEFANSLGLSVSVTTYPSFFALYTAVIQKSALTQFGNYGLAQASRLVPRANFVGPDNQNALVDAVTHAVSDTGPIKMSLMLLLTTPPPSIQDTGSSLTPAWRDAIWHVIYTTMWDPSTTNSSQIQQRFEAVTYAMDPLRKLTPGGGAYLNEGDTYEPDPVEAFWGKKNHERLVRIKSELDPNSIMVVHQGIGSDKVPERFGCYPAVRQPQQPARGEL